MSSLKVKTTHDTRFQSRADVCFNEMLTKHPVNPEDMAKFFGKILVPLIYQCVNISTERASLQQDLCAGFSSSVCPIGRACESWQVQWEATFACDDRGCEAGIILRAMKIY